MGDVERQAGTDKVNDACVPGGKKLTERKGHIHEQEKDNFYLHIFILTSDQSYSFADL